MRKHNEKARSRMNAGDYNGAQRELGGAMFQAAADGAKSIAGFFGRLNEKKNASGNVRKKSVGGGKRHSGGQNSAKLSLLRFLSWEL